MIVIVLLIVILLVPVLGFDFEMVSGLDFFLVVPGRVVGVTGPRCVCARVHVPVVIILGMVTSRVVLISGVIVGNAFSA